MRKFYNLEIIAIVFIFLYQFANKSLDEKFIGIDKMIFFLLFGFYSILLTLFEFYFIRGNLKNIIQKKNADRLDIIVAALLYFFIGVLLFINKTINSRFYAFNLVFGFTYIIKSILFGVLYRKLSQTPNSL